MERTRIFAYGSNMHPERMRARVPGALPIGRARLEGHRLVFNKRGADGSAKANLEPDPQATVWGVVWELTVEEIASLDPYEGGYERVRVVARDDEDATLEVEVYVSARLTDDPTPFDWYLEHVLRGARAHGLPDEYIAWLESLSARADDSDSEGG